MTSETIMAAYHALYQAVSEETSPYQEELLSALSALESGLQAHIDSVRPPSDGDGPPGVAECYSHHGRFVSPCRWHV